MLRIGTETTTDNYIVTPARVATFTATQDGEVYIQVYLAPIAGDGVYEMCYTKRLLGTGLEYQSKTTNVTVDTSGRNITFLTTAISVQDTDVIKVYVQGLAGDTEVDSFVEVFDAAHEYDTVIATVDTNVDAVLADTGTDGVVLANDAITLSKFDESTAFPLVASDAGATQIARVGADSDTLETLSDQIDAVPTAPEIWANADRTLTQAANDVIDAVTGTSITKTRGNSWDFEITGVTLDTNKQQFMVKKNSNDTDNEALLFVDSASGLLRLNGAAVTDATKASLSYATTVANPVVDTDVTDKLPPGEWHWALQGVTAAGVVKEPYSGVFTLTADYVRATE